MKKIVLFIMAISASLMFISCTNEDEVALVEDEQIFTLQALSSSSLLSYQEAVVEETAYSNPTRGEDVSEPKITTEVENIDYYVEMMDMFLGDDNLNVEQSESDNEDYEYLTVYSVRNINGEMVTYKFYYNEFDLTAEDLEEVPATTYSENPENPGFRFSDEDDDLVIMGLEGILIYGDLTYNIEGKKINNGQQEIYRLRSFIDEENFVLVNYQVDVLDGDREKFFFKTVENGEVVSESKVMMFTRNDRLHLKLEFTEGESYEKYIFNIRTEGDKQYIHIVYEISDGVEVEEGNVKLTSEIDPETGDVIYSYDMSPNRGSQYQNSFRHRHQYNNQVNTSQA